MDNNESKRILLYPKIKNVLNEVKEIAYLIKQLNASNDQEIINYEDILNKYSNTDYNTI